MLNYIKSEMFRLRNSKGLKIGVGIITLLFLWMGLTIEPGLATYLSESMSVVYILVPFLVAIIFGDEFKNRTINNSISSGVSSRKIYFGKIIISTITGIIVLLWFAILASLIQNNTKERIVLFKSLVVCMPTFIAAVIVTITLIFMVKSNMGVVIGFGGNIIIYFIVESLKARDFCNEIVLDRISLMNILFKTYYGENEYVDYPSWCVKEGSINIIIASIVTIAINIIVGIIITRKRK